MCTLIDVDWAEQIAVIIARRSAFKEFLDGA